MLTREDPSCTWCGSNVRFRSIVDLVSRHFFQQSLTLSDFPVRREISGVGLSDWEGYATPLSRSFSYTNTHFHKPPILDITDPPGDLTEKYDFIISSDVFEHVNPPIQKVFSNAYALLKPGGILIMTVPYMPMKETLEHYPDAVGYETISETEVVLQLKDGGTRTINDAKFHGGPGSTLEMRLFGEHGIKSCLDSAGFKTVTFHGSSNLERGISYSSDFSLPVTAIKPAR